MQNERLRQDSTGPTPSSQDEWRPCVACGNADWREFFRLTSLHDRVAWMDRNVARPRPGEELVAVPSGRRPDATAE